MPTSIIDILDSIGDVAGDLLVVASVLLLFIGVLYMSSFYQWFSALALFSGVVLLVTGFAIRLMGPLTLTKPSIGGLGAILICISLVTIASAGIFALFATPAGLRLRGSIFKGYFTGYVGTIETAHPLVWLLTPLATIGLGLLVVGVLLKVYDGL